MLMMINLTSTPLIAIFMMMMMMIKLHDVYTLAISMLMTINLTSTPLIAIFMMMMMMMIKLTSTSWLYS